MVGEGAGRVAGARRVAGPHPDEAGGSGTEILLAQNLPYRGAALPVAGGRRRNWKG